jgi:hypothetical protein
MFETFGDYLKEQIKQSPEWKALFASSPETKTSKGADDDFGDDEIPF